MKTIVFISLALSLLSCSTYTPKKIAYYDEKCEVSSNKLVLSEKQVKLIRKNDACVDKECEDMIISRILSSVVESPVSYVVSGTIVLTGNTLQWFEKRGECE